MGNEIDGFHKEDFKVLKRCDKKGCYRKLLPKLRKIRDRVLPQIQKEFPEMHGKTSQPFRSTGDHVWLNFSEVVRHVPRTTHYSLVLFDDESVEFIVHLQKGGQNYRKFKAKFRENRELRKFYNLLKMLPRDYFIRVGGKDKDKGWEEKITNLDEKLLKTLLNILDLNGYRITIGKWISSSIYQNGNKLKKTVLNSFKNLKEVYNFLHSK